MFVDKLNPAISERADAQSPGDITGCETRFGNSSYVLPSSRLPAAALRTPPHCLKKKATRLCLHSSRKGKTHSFFIGLAPAPLSPPTIIQSISRRTTLPRSSNNGSTERKRTSAFVFRKSSIRGKPYFLSSTLTPHQMCRCSAAKRSFVLRSLRRRSDRLVST